MKRVIRVLAYLVVLAVAVFAFIVSYSHIYDLGQANGQFGAAGRLLPLSIDGLIVAASLVLLEAALSGRSTPGLARAMLWAGVAATLAANALYGRTWGALGVMVSTLPAASFVGAVEMLFGMVRSAHAELGEDVLEVREEDVLEVQEEAGMLTPAPTPVPVVADVATDGPRRHAAARPRRATVRAPRRATVREAQARERRAEAAYRQSPVPARQLARNHRISRKRADAVVARVDAGQSNGHREQVGELVPIP